MEHPLIPEIRSQLHRMQPLATNLPPVLPTLSGIQALLFDVYGTLLISGSGDVGVGATELDRSDAAEDALRATGVTSSVDGRQVVERLHAAIRASHEQSLAEQIPHPEIDIREIWQAVGHELDLEPPAEARAGSVSWPEQIAVEYELRVNPIWPMPGAIECLRLCRSAGKTLGVVSNAQFFTPLMWRAATSLSFEQAGFDPLMQYFSYVHGRSKPGLALFQLAASALNQRGIPASQVLYVGNDMRNDIAPAAAVGFRTALFAGDQRSLRLREADAELHELKADVTLVELKQLSAVLGI